MAGPSDGASRAGRRKIVAHVVFGVVGLGAIALLVRGVGPATLFKVVRASAAWLPLLFALDALRIVAEAVATYALSEPVRRHVPRRELARVHLVGYAVAMSMPAGRAAAESVKAAMLARYIGPPGAAAVGVANQTTTLLGSALAALPTVAASLWLTGLSPLTLAFTVFTVFTAGAFVVLQVACRRRELGDLVLRRFERMAEATTAFREALARIPVVPPLATLAVLAGRVVVVIELAILLHVLGGRHGLGQALLAQGVINAGGAVGDFVPGQLGATDGAFALAAPYLGMALVDGVALSVLLHCLQVMWAVVGWTVPFFWKAPASAPTPGDAGERPTS